MRQRQDYPTFSDKELEGRKRLTIRIEDVDGAISAVVEEARP